MKTLNPSNENVSLVSFLKAAQRLASPFPAQSSVHLVASEKRQAILFPVNSSEAAIHLSVNLFNNHLKITSTLDHICE
jgi:hypothetical protein